MATTRIPFKPARGGQAEQDRFHEQYRATIRSDRQHFSEPPADQWPPVDGRFGRDLQTRRDRIRRPLRPWRGWSWPIQVSTLLVCLALMAPGIAKAAAGASYDQLPESRDLMVQLVNQLNFGASLTVGFIISYSHLRPLILQPSNLSKIPQLNNEQLAYLSAGPTRVIELGLASLVRQGVLKVNSRSRTLVLTGQTDYAMSDSAKLGNLWATGF
jgi:hypothetical protein